MISDQKQKVPQYRGMFHAASTIVRSEGFSGVYKGVGPTIIKQGSNQAIRFTVMETLRKMYTGGDNRVSVPMHMVSGRHIIIEPNLTQVPVLTVSNCRFVCSVPLLELLV